MSNNYYYSKGLDIYISLEPLKVNEKILNISRKHSINLKWNDSGIINYLNYCEAKLILGELNEQMLSPRELFYVLNEAKEEGRVDVIKSLTSNEYVEWLDTVYTMEDENVTAIEHPDIKVLNNKYEFIGESSNVNMVKGRPGWIVYTEEKSDLGLPVNVYENFNYTDSKEETWKYWSVSQENSYVCPIRGYVLSSGTPSLDMDIPYIARQPVLTVRACKKSIDVKSIDDRITMFCEKIIEDYCTTLTTELGCNNLEKINMFYWKWIDEFKNIPNDLFRDIKKLDNKQFEKLIEILGLLKIVSIVNNDYLGMDKLKNIDDQIVIKDTTISLEKIKKYIRELSDKLSLAYTSGKEVVFVMGHENPDTDTVISSIFEAYRNTLNNNDKLYVPIIQSKHIPSEIKELLGIDISNYLILYNDELYLKIKKSGYARWILVDHNWSEVQKYVVSIIDHHRLNDSIKNNNLNIPITWEMTGSTAALVTFKLLAQGIKLEEDAAKLLYAATLMDTENRNESKVSSKDILIMDYLKKVSNTLFDEAVYKKLMDKLLQAEDIELLFNRDYKDDWGIFGYAVVKIKGLYNCQGDISRLDVFTKLRELANQNNRKNNYSVTLVKVVDYMDDNETINRERLEFVFSNTATEEYKHTLVNYAENLIRKQFNDKSNVKKYKSYIEYWGTGKQLSRKFTAPYFEPIIRAFNEFFYSPSTNLYVKREFMKISDELTNIAKEHNIILNADDKNRVNYITFKEAIYLIKSAGKKILTLQEYWKVMDDALELNDTQMINHLRSKDFVEMLDTVIIDKKYIINNCSFDDENGAPYGEKMNVDILEAVPALISKDDIDKATGLPFKLGEANQYEKKELWRYWSPDADICIVTRGHIFLLDQSALDTKIHLNDRLPNLGVRECVNYLEAPNLNFNTY